MDLNLIIKHFSIYNAIHLAFQSATNFTMALHNDNNFTRKAGTSKYTEGSFTVSLNL